MPKSTFERLSEERKSALLEAAGDCFMEIPYEEIRIEDITKAMGIPAGTFYRYFKDKEDVAVCFFERGYKEDETILMNADKSIVFHPIEPDSEKMKEYAKQNAILSKIPEVLAEKVILAHSEEQYEMYKRFLVQLKYEGRIREDIDPDLIAFMWSSSRDLQSCSQPWLSICLAMD